MKRILTELCHAWRCIAHYGHVLSVQCTTHVRIGCYCSINPFVMDSCLCQSQTHEFLVTFAVLTKCMLNRDNRRLNFSCLQMNWPFHFNHNHVKSFYFIDVCASGRVRVFCCGFNWMDDLWLNAWAQHFHGQYRMGWNVRKLFMTKWIIMIPIYVRILSAQRTWA